MDKGPTLLSAVDNCSGPNAASWRADLNRLTAGAGWLTDDL